MSYFRQTEFYCYTHTWHSLFTEAYANALLLHCIISSTVVYLSHQYSAACYYAASGSVIADHHFSVLRCHYALIICCNLMKSTSTTSPCLWSQKVRGIISICKILISPNSYDCRHLPFANTSYKLKFEHTLAFTASHQSHFQLIIHLQALMMCFPHVEVIIPPVSSVLHYCRIVCFSWFYITN